MRQSLSLVRRLLDLVMQRYSVEPRDQIIVKDHEVLFLAKNMGKNIDKNIIKNVRGKQSQNLRNRSKRNSRWLYW